MITSNKPIVEHLISFLITIGVKHVFISPGSRNAPLIIAFTGINRFKCYSIADERSAAHYALGMSRQLNEPVAVVCTSGTAVLNLAPALAESYYQEVPIIAITADRPSEWIDQEDGQTIHQQNIFNNYIKHSCHLPDEKQSGSVDTALNELRQLITVVNRFPLGPIHINIPLAEPLYEQVEITDIEPFKFKIDPKAQVPGNIELITDLWGKSEKVLLVCGVMLPNDETNLLVGKISEILNIQVIGAATSNISGHKILNTPESLLAMLNEENMEIMRPELLITIGGPVISKNLKQFLRKYKPAHHVDIDLNPLPVDTYRCLTHKIISDAKSVLKFLIEKCRPKAMQYCNLWLNLKSVLFEKHALQMGQLEWCDLYIYYQIIEKWGFKGNLHLANSTPIRYAELFDKKEQINYYANRGTSGIDGCLSTAAGAALATDRPTLIITGDVGFFYDSNCFYNSQLPENLKVIVINNGGGNIFKILPGPKTTPEISYFTTPHKFNARGICQAFGVSYYYANSSKDFLNVLDEFLLCKECSVLEVNTSLVNNPDIYSNYFEKIANS
jgi:2-succinyl-5-enolpyruvyl-6-hydroxy-3-cyclohexene-1-carboxylate synthase